MREKRICEKCLREKVLSAFAGDDSRYCRLCLSGEGSAALRAEGIKKRYPDIACPNCGGLVQNLIRHFRQDHPDHLDVIHDLCKASVDQTVLDLNRRLLTDQQVADRDRIWDTNTSVVYFIQAGDLGRPVKIGYTIDLCARLVCIQAGSPEPMSVLLTVLGGRELEREMHSRFADLRVHQEFFRVSKGMLEFLLEERKVASPVPVRKRGSLHVVKRRKPERFTYDECRAIAQQYGVIDSNDWYIKHKAKLLPKGTPYSPRHAYQQEWTTWGEFLSAVVGMEDFDPDSKPEPEVVGFNPELLSKSHREIRATVKYKVTHEALSNRGSETLIAIAKRIGVDIKVLGEIYAGRHWSCEFFGLPQGKVVPRGQPKDRKPPKVKLTVVELGVKRRKFTSEQEVKIIEEYKSMSMSQLAEKYTCCYHTIHDLLVRNGVELRGVGVGPRKLAGKWSWKRSPEDLAKFKEVHEALYTRENETQQEVADRFGVPLTTINNINSGDHWSCQFFGKPVERPKSKGANGRFKVSTLAGKGHTKRATKAIERAHGLLEQEEAFNLMLGLESE